MDDLSDELMDAYRATAFHASTPSPLVIRVGQFTPALDKMMEDALVSDWAFISAWNPGSEPLSVSENETRHLALCDDLKSFQHVYEGRGVPDNDDWAPEASLLVLNISRSEAVKIGHRYGQNAIVAGRLGDVAELVICKT